MSNTMEGFKELIVFIFLVIFFRVRGEGCNNDSASKSAGVRLSNDLLCGYNRNVRPVINQSSQINVDMTPRIYSFFMDEEWEVMTVTFVLSMTWKDEFLTWDPSKYENIKDIQEYSYTIWTPDIVSLNPGVRDTKPNEFSNFLPMSAVNINNNGKIYYVDFVTLHAQCSTNIAKWPFDSHNCSLFIGSPFLVSGYVNYSLPENIYFVGNSPNREWALKDIHTQCVNFFPFNSNISHCFLQLTLNVERFSSMYYSTVIIPTVVISLMRTFTFLMGREISLRISLLCLFFISELLYIQFLDIKIPNNGENSVYIVLLCRNSLILTAVALIISVISNAIYKRSTEDFPPDGPEWTKNLIKLLLSKKAISTLTNFNTQGTELLIENDVKEDTPDSQRYEKALFWKTLSILLDRLFFLITLILSFFNFLFWVL